MPRHVESDHVLPLLPGDEPGDSYSGAAETYDPDKPYTRATDEHGHSGKRQPHFHPDQLAILDRVARRLPAPLDTPNAIIRSALTHYLHKLVAQLNDGYFEAEQAEYESDAAIELLRFHHGRRTAKVEGARAAYEDFAAGRNALGMGQLVMELDVAADITPQPYAGQLEQMRDRARNWLEANQ